MVERTRIGEIALLQIHRDLLVSGDRYDPAPLAQVEALSVDQSGAVGWMGDAWAVDVHHRSWPGRGGRRPLSVGFTSHYRKMTTRFGAVPLGTAGENVIVDYDEVVRRDDLGEAIVIVGRDEVVLTAPQVARPCRQFTSYLLGLPHLAEPEEIAAELEFLDGGTRGFIFQVEGIESPAIIKPGDVVYRC
jgi:hypothetical protein